MVGLWLRGRKWGRTVEEFIEFQIHGLHGVSEAGKDGLKVTRGGIMRRGTRHGGTKREHQC